MIQQSIFPFKIEMTEEKLTAHGGLALMAEFNHGIGLRGLTDKYLPVPGSNRGYKPSVFVDALVLMLQGGGRHLEDLRELEEERELLRLIGGEVIPNPDAVGDWLRRMGKKKTGEEGLNGLNEVRKIINHRIMRRDGICGYTLDADATGIIGEKAEAQYTYKGYKGYMPVLGFLYENNICINDEFREGNASPSSGQEGFYERCKDHMPDGKRIIYYRADSASYQSGLINKLEKDGVRYAITADQDRAVKAAIGEIKEGEWIEPERGCGYEIAETVHSMNKTEKAFRIIIKRVYHQPSLFKEVENGTVEEEKTRYHVIATNWGIEEKSAKEIVRWHNERGTAENFNKEIKQGFGMERMPCGQTEANAVFFRIGVIAYNLFIGFKRLSCPDSWRRHTIATFRWKMVQIAGKIVRHAGEIVMKLAIDIEKLRMFREIRRNIFGLNLCTDG